MSLLTFQYFSAQYWIQLLAQAGKWSLAEAQSVINNTWGLRNEKFLQCTSKTEQKKYRQTFLPDNLLRATVRTPCRKMGLNRTKEVKPPNNLFPTTLRITLKRNKYERGQGETLHRYKHRVFDPIVLLSPFPHLHQAEPKLSPATSQEVTVTHVPWGHRLRRKDGQRTANWPGYDKLLHLRNSHLLPHRRDSLRCCSPAHRQPQSPQC